MKLFARLSLAAALLAATAAHADEVMKKDGILVNQAGMTVYTFDKDSAGRSNCVGPCADNWPAVKAGEALAAPYSAITREDGSRQLAYQGKPLYTFKKDLQPGDRNGDGVKDIWHIVKD